MVGCVFVVVVNVQSDLKEEAKTPAQFVQIFDHHVANHHMHPFKLNCKQLVKSRKWQTETNLIEKCQKISNDAKLHCKNNIEE